MIPAPPVSRITVSMPDINRVMTTTERWFFLRVEIGGSIDEVLRIRTVYETA